MKKCKFCGAEIKEGMKFCFKCGKAVDESPASNNENPKADANTGDKSEPIKNAEKIWNSKKINPKIIGAAAAGVLLIGGGIYFANHRYTTFDLQDYLEVTTTGYNKVGTVKAYVDDEKLFDDIYRVAAKKSNMSFYGEAQLYELADVDVELSKSENLSNGDEVTISFANINEKALKDYKIKYKTTPKKVKVEGLEDIDMVDVFKDLEIPFEGAAPELSVTPGGFTRTIDGREYSFSVDPSQNLSVGDEITVTCRNTTPVDGVIPEKNEIKIKVPDTVDQYVTDPKVLTKEMGDALIASANDRFESHKWFEGIVFRITIIANSLSQTDDWKPVSTLDLDVSNFKVENEALFYNTFAKHKMLMRFEFDASGDGQTYHAYGYTWADDLILHGDGTLTFDEVNDVCSQAYVDRADREKALEDEYKSTDVESTTYKVALDASEKPEVFYTVEK